MKPKFLLMPDAIMSGTTQTTGDKKSRTGLVGMKDLHSLPKLVHTNFQLYLRKVTMAKE